MLEFAEKLPEIHESESQRPRGNAYSHPSDYGDVSLVKDKMVGLHTSALNQQSPSDAPIPQDNETIIKERPQVVTSREDRCGYLRLGRDAGLGVHRLNLVRGNGDGSRFGLTSFLLGESVGGKCLA